MRLRQIVATAATSFAVLAIGSGFSARPAAAQTGDSQVRVAHFSPDAPAVDIYVDGKKKLTGLPYEQVSEYLKLPAGKHTFALRPTSAAADSKAIVESGATLEGSKSYTVAAVGKADAIKATVFEDDLTPPAPKKAKIRIIHAAPDVPAVDVVVKGGPSLFEKAAFPSATPYKEVDATKYEIEVRKSGSSDALLPSSQVVFSAGGIYTIAAIGGGNQPTKLKGLIDLQPGSEGAIGGAATTAAPTTAAAVETSQAPDAPISVPAGADTTVAETTVPETTAVTETTAAAVSETTIASDTTIAVDTTVAPDTTVAETPSTEATVDSAPATDAPPPSGGVKTGFGGMSDSQSASFLALLAVAGGAIATAGLRRRMQR